MRFMRRPLLSAIPILAILLGGAWYWLYGPCGTKRIAETTVQLNAQTERSSDAVRLAASTPAIALSGPLSKLQDIRRDTRNLDIPPCASHTRDHLVSSMQTLLEALLEFSSTPLTARGEAAEAKVKERTAEAADQLGLFREEMDYLSGCSPR